MHLTPLQVVITIVAIAAGTALTRFLPFWLFPEHRPAPKVVLYLGKVLPPAMLGLLVIYCLRNVSFTGGTYGIAEGIAIAVLVLLHVKFRNVLLSIGVSTVLYMAIVQLP